MNNSSDKTYMINTDHSIKWFVFVKLPFNIDRFSISFLLLLLSLFFISVDLYSQDDNNDKKKKEIRIKHSLPLWQKYLNKSKNIKDGAAFIPLAMRMVIEQLAITDRDDLYNLDIQIHLALKEMAFFRGYEEGSRKFRALVNLTARKGDRIEMIVHPSKKTLDLHVNGVIINFDVFDIYLKTLDMSKFVTDDDKRMSIVAVIGEESLIIEKNFETTRELDIVINDIADLDSISYMDFEQKEILKPIYHFKEKFYDFSASFYGANNHNEVSLFFTGTISEDNVSSSYYRYLISAVDLDVLTQLELGIARKEWGFILQGGVNLGYNVLNNDLFFGVSGAIVSSKNIGLYAETNLYNVESSYYDKNDIHLTPRTEILGSYFLQGYFDLYSGLIFENGEIGYKINVASGDLYFLEFLKYLLFQYKDYFTSNTYILDLTVEQFFTENYDHENLQNSNGDDIILDNLNEVRFKVGLTANFRIGDTKRNELNNFTRKNRVAFTR